MCHPVSKEVNTTYCTQTRGKPNWEGQKIQPFKTNICLLKTVDIYAKHVLHRWIQRRPSLWGNDAFPSVSDFPCFPIEPFQKFFPDFHPPKFLMTFFSHRRSSTANLKSPYCRFFSTFSPYFKEIIISPYFSKFSLWFRKIYVFLVFTYFLCFSFSTIYLCITQ